jgi:hypothetical protein
MRSLAKKIKQDLREVVLHTRKLPQRLDRRQQPGAL